MADISKINGYDIKDKVARESIDKLATVANSGDYNDLENKPFYDTRNLERIELTFDGNLEGKETVGDTEVFVKITDIVYKEDLDEMINGAMSYWISDTGDVDVTNLAQKGAQIDVLVEEKLYLVAEFIVVALDDVEYSALGEYPFTKGLWFVYIEDFLHIKGLSFNRNTTTICNQSNTYTLDSKGNAWFAGDVTIGEDNKRLATEEYVDNNKGVTDYNDLENKPFYDSRVYVDEVIEYDGVADGKAIGAAPALGSSSLIKVADLTVSQQDAYMEALKKGYKLTIIDGDGNTTVQEDVEYYTFVDGAFYIPNGYVVFAPQTFSVSIGHADNYVSEPGIYVNSTKNFKLELQVTKGEFKTIDSKYLVNSPGAKVEEGLEITSGDNINYTVRQGAEIFNDYKENKAAGSYSHAEGSRTEALGEFSHAEGFITKAIGDYSHAEGLNSRTSGSSAHAEGYNVEATGDYSHAEGSDTIASGECSHAEGINTTAAGEHQHVQGRNNIVDEENRYAHIVGNGGLSYGDEPSNAHTLDWDGNAWYAGNITIGKDNKQLATESFVTEQLNTTLDNIVLKKITQVEYDALAVKDPNTLYIII